MIPVEFLCTSGNFSEKKFLTLILKEGITYVCDRGYISFSMLNKICLQSAYFVIRGKSNLQYAIESRLDVVVPDKFLKFFSDISDAKIVFNNDKNAMIYRIINFTALGESYCLITKRFALTTYQVIMLYVYRWQVEIEHYDYIYKIDFCLMISLVTFFFCSCSCIASKQPHTHITHKY